MFGAVLVTLIVLFFTVSTLHHQKLKKEEQRSCPPPGTLVDVFGDRMHIYAKGTKSPALLFSCGNGMFSYGNFYPIYTPLSKTNRVILYDRCGYGWSDSTRRPRTMEQINLDLHELLKRSGEKGPFVLIGHSLGATELLQFAQRYPELTAGLIMLDGGSPEFYRKSKGVFLRSLPAYGITSFLRATGILRLLLRRRPPHPDMPREVDQAYTMMITHRSSHLNSLQQVKALSSITPIDRDLGETPLLVITAMRSGSLGEAFKSSQEELLKLSTRSRQVIMEEGSHFFPMEYPDLMVEEIRRFLNEDMRR